MKRFSLSPIALICMPLLVKCITDMRPKKKSALQMDLDFKVRMI